MMMDKVLLDDNQRDLLGDATHKLPQQSPTPMSADIKCSIGCARVVVPEESRQQPSH